jgi:hypothetical protein
MTCHYWSRSWSDPVKYYPMAPILVNRRPKFLAYAPGDKGLFLRQPFLFGTVRSNLKAVWSIPSCRRSAEQNNLAARILRSSKPTRSVAVNRGRKSLLDAGHQLRKITRCSLARRAVGSEFDRLFPVALCVRNIAGFISDIAGFKRDG